MLTFSVGCRDCVKLVGKLKRSAFTPCLTRGRLTIFSLLSFVRRTKLLQVRPRRLGTRGNSRYCYAGLRKRTKLEVPLTPDISHEGRGGGPGEAASGEEEQNSATSYLIRCVTQRQILE